MGKQTAASGALCPLHEARRHPHLMFTTLAGTCTFWESSSSWGATTPCTASAASTCCCASALPPCRPAVKGRAWSTACVPVNRTSVCFVHTCLRAHGLAAAPFQPAQLCASLPAASPLPASAHAATATAGYKRLPRLTRARASGWRTRRFSTAGMLPLTAWRARRAGWDLKDRWHDGVQHAGRQAGQLNLSTLLEQQYFLSCLCPRSWSSQTARAGGCSASSCGRRGC